MTTYGIKIDLGDNDYIWVTEGFGDYVEIKEFDSFESAILECKTVWSGAWANNRVSVEEIK